MIVSASAPVTPTWPPVLFIITSEGLSIVTVPLFTKSAIAPLKKVNVWPVILLMPPLISTVPSLILLTPEPNMFVVPDVIVTVGLPVSTLIVLVEFRIDKSVSVSTVTVFLPPLI